MNSPGRTKARRWILLVVAFLILVFLWWFLQPSRFEKSNTLSSTPDTRPPAKVSLQPAILTDYDRLQGVWKRFPVHENDSGWRLEFKGREAQLFQKHRDGSISWGHGWQPFTLNEMTIPKQINIQKTQLQYGIEFGIYEFDENKLKLCFGATDAEHRPTQFLEMEQSDGKYQVWEFYRENKHPEK